MGRIWALSVVFVLSAPAIGAAQTPSPIPGVDVEIREDFYELRSNRLWAVIATLNEMRLEGPDAPRSQGLTRYRIDPEWRPRAGGGRCRVGDLRLRVEIDILLPRWDGLEDADAEDAERWRTIAEAIRDHEYIHRDLTIAAANELHAALSALEPNGCGALRQAVAGTVSIAARKLTEAHAELDRTPRRIGEGRG